MKTHLVLGCLYCFVLVSCSQQPMSKTPESTTHAHTNALIHESSPYLLQHAHNPVDWYPWGEEALKLAKKENKLLLVSVGYAACHWCHVMEHESFEDEEVAEYMNAHFVCVKVDREERPDVDQVYMNAAQLVTGRGGWPLNCIALPDGRPLYAGTYFPKEQWLNVLSQVYNFVQQYPDRAEQQAQSLTDGVKSSELIVLNEQQIDLHEEDLELVFKNWKQRIDYEEGGHQGAPKFPMPVGFQYLLSYYDHSGNQDALRAVQVTLDKMASGGIYDQIGGGFARYSVDDIWKVPHFEKMLYDNGQLVSLYAAAYQLSNNPRYKQVVEQSLDFIERELTSKEGGFYSSLDADSEGEEGKFYVWTMEELRSVLGDRAELIAAYYRATEKGNWEHGNNILLRTEDEERICQKFEISAQDLAQEVEKAQKALMKERATRVRPGLDDKVLTSWNGLMLKGYVDAYRALGKEEYLNTALRNAEFLLQHMKEDDHRLNRNYKEGKASINGFLDDYAFTISAFVALYQATFNEKWLMEAQHLCEYAIENFYDGKSGMFFYTSKLDPALIARKMEVSDNVIPAANSEMAKNLFVLGQYFYKEDYTDKARKMLNNVKEQTFRGNTYYANWDALMLWLIHEPFQVAIVGKDYEAKRKELGQQFLPNAFFMGGADEGSLPLLENKLQEGKTMIYVCRDKACKLPTPSVDEALRQLVD